MTTDNNVRKWAARVSSKTPLLGARASRTACRKLADLKSTQAVPFLVSALASPDARVRGIAVDGLAALTDPVALDALALASSFTKADALRDVRARLGSSAPEAMGPSSSEDSPARRPWTLRNDRDGTLLAFVPEGDFLAGEDGFPLHLDPYWLAFTRVTNAQYARFLSDLRPDRAKLDAWIALDSSSQIRRKDGAFVMDPEHADLPVMQVRWEGADAYCRWAGLRLPTELEWEKGARGVDGRQYPWGNNWEDGRTRPAQGKRLPEEIAPVRAHPTGRSPYGLYEMIGGLFEWCADWYDPSAYDRYRQGDLTPPAKGENRVLRGGPWCFGTPAYVRTEYRRSTVWRAGTLLCGFRCAKSL